MNPLSMESIFLILTGVILMAGILYWFWSHIQLTQKKVQLLENAVFELRGMLTNRPEPPAPSGGGAVAADVAGSGSGSPYNDLADDDWEAEEEAADGIREVEQTSTPLDALDEGRTVTIAHEESAPAFMSSNLQPGGRIEVPSMEELEAEEKRVDEFRELFVNRETPVASPSHTPTPVAASQESSESLSSMPVKELRRLAEQRGISGANEMRKKEILAALRQQISPASAPATASAPAPVLDTFIEKALAVDEAVTDAIETTEAEILE